MMQFRMQLLYKLTLGVICILWTQQAQAELMRDENSLNSLYDNLLQREYPGPVVFPNHQVERKAQRSPSLRLRFGRRSDPELMQDLPQKRWFGEVNQKPIRSPSLRLRFGRRSDPNMPMHSPFDILMNSQQQKQDQQAFSSPAENMDDYNDLYGNYYDRIIRKPQRLRFGRSLPFSSNNNNGGLMNNHENNLQNIEDDTDNEDMNEMTLGNSQDDFYNSMLHSQKLKQLLLTLRQFENLENQGEPGSLASSNFDENNFEAGDINQFERAIRKPGPLRLRFGRSANNLQRQSMLTDLAEQSNERIAKQSQKEQQQQQQHQEEKKTLNDVSNSVDKTQNQQDKD